MITLTMVLAGVVVIRLSLSKPHRVRKEDQHMQSAVVMLYEHVAYWSCTWLAMVR